MIAVFGLKKDFELLKKSNKDSKQLLKLVTDNIQIDFNGYNIEAIMFLPNHTAAYPNPLRTYTQVLAYIRGPRTEAALEQLKQLIEIEQLINRIRKDMTNGVVGYHRV